MESEDQNPFECNICLETAQQPVITFCGHIYCWSCIYAWLNSNQQFLSCPVCKNGINSNELISLYTKSDKYSDQQTDPSLPPRPKIVRQQPQVNQNQLGENGQQLNRNNRMNLQQGVMLAGYGYFPSLFNLLFQVGNKIDDRGLEFQSPEMQYQIQFKAIIGFLLFLFITNIIVSIS